MAEAASSDTTLAEIAASYRELSAARESVALRALAGLVDHIAHDYRDSRLICWTSTFSLCISQHRWTSPSDWLPYLRVQPLPGEKLEFRYHDSQVGKLDWVRVVPSEGVIGRFDTFVEQLHWRPKMSQISSAAD